NERNIKIKTQFLILDSRVQPILSKDSANRTQYQNKSKVFEGEELMSGSEQPLPHQRIQV
ncbi:MAG: hypothetical protein ACI4BC_06495, partial [Muribaculaceae bacterium]